MTDKPTNKKVDEQQDDDLVAEDEEKKNSDEVRSADSDDEYDEEDDEYDEEDDEYEDEEDDDEDEDYEPDPPPKRSRAAEMNAGMSLGIVAFVAFGFGAQVLTRSIELHNVNYYSHSGWIFLISFFSATLSAMFFLRSKEGGSKNEQKPKVVQDGVEQTYRQEPGEKKAQLLDSRPASWSSVEPGRLAIGIGVFGSLYAVYWWKAAEVWNHIYTETHPWLWSVYALLFIGITAGVYYALRPPSEREEADFRMPNRRVMLLVSVPFLLVFGMLWMASIHPPWPQ